MSILASQRHLFDLADDITYLNCAYCSPMSDPVRVACEGATRIEQRPWEWGSEMFFAPVARLRERFAALIGSTAECVVVAPATSYVLATAARNLPLEKGQKIVLLAEQFPSNYYCWLDKAERCGGTLDAVARPASGESWSECVLSAIDERVAIVTLPAVHWADGTVLDLLRIAQRTRQVGAALVLDLSQSLGAMPFSVADIDPDFVVAAAYKWLLGPYGMALGYIHPRWHAGQPLENNWMHRQGSEDFTRLVDYQDAFQPGARRFETGQSASFHQVAMATAGLELIAEWGVANIAETLAAWTARFCDEAETMGMVAPASPERSGHVVGVRFPDEPPPGLVSNLRAQAIFVSVRGDSLRVSPYLYNEASEGTRLLRVLEEIGLRTR